MSEDRRAIHGTRLVEGVQHPVFDLDLWETKIAVPEKLSRPTWVYSPPDIVALERCRRAAAPHGGLGPSSACDVFVWSDRPVSECAWLTRIGGTPYRRKRAPWPTDTKGNPLVFLGQISFVDSPDARRADLPGDVALIYGQSAGGRIPTAVTTVGDREPRAGMVEWAVSNDDRYSDETYPKTFPSTPCLLGVEYHGVLHRTVQYTDQSASDLACEAAGFPGAFGIGRFVATLIGASSDFSQSCDAIEEGTHELIAVLGSLSFQSAPSWPLCDIPSAPMEIREGGHLYPAWNAGAMDFSIVSHGSIALLRDERGQFSLYESFG